MKLSEIVPDPDVLIAYEPDELGLLMLPMLAEQGHYGVRLSGEIAAVNGTGQTENQYSNGNPSEIERAIREAWAWLRGEALLVPRPPDPATHQVWQGDDNLEMRLSRRAQRLATQRVAQRKLTARRLPKEILHESIREDVWQLYHRGKYDMSVFEAMKAVEVAVRVAAKLTADDIGVPLMRKAFGSHGALTNKNAQGAERQARADLFAGAIGSYKNAHSHRRVGLDDPDEAAEIIMLANHLLRIVDTWR